MPLSSGWNPKTLVDQLELTSAAWGERVGLIEGEVRLTWGQILERSQEIARALLAAGVKPNDRVALWLPNLYWWPLFWMAAAHIGAIIVPINTRYKAAEAAYIVQQSRSKIVVACDSYFGVNYLAMLSEICEILDGISADRSGLREIVVISTPPTRVSGIPFTDCQAFLAKGEQVPLSEVLAARAGRDWREPNLIVYTSGTTGEPKGAVHSHEILRTQEATCAWFSLDQESVLLGHMPLYHVAGALSGWLPTMISGGALVLLSHWDPETAIQLIQEYGVTMLAGTPTHYIDLIDLAADRGTKITTVRNGWIGGATLPERVFRQATTVLGMAPPLPAYGMTETSAFTACGELDDPLEVLISGAMSLYPDVEMEIRSADGCALAAGVEGEVTVRGHLVMMHYFDMPDETSEVIDADGWFRTGDLGFLDERHRLHITGRANDMFIVGGTNAYPAEIERVLSSHPGVRMAVVFGVPDVRLGEVGCAAIELHPGAQATREDLTEFCRRRLADYKVPRHMVFMSDWPLTPSGKVRKFVLRGEFDQEHTM